MDFDIGSLDVYKPEEIVYDYIKKKIISKAMFPGYKIVEEDLSAKLGVSRTPIRAALKRLSYEGIVNAIPNKGAYVAAPTKEEIHSAYMCRQVLEAEAIRLACREITPAQMEILDELIEAEVETHADLNMQAFLNINARFHNLIAEASGNQFIYKYVSELVARCDVYLLFYDRFYLYTQETSKALKEHREILDALKSGDEALCVETATRHNINTLADLELAR